MSNKPKIFGNCSAGCLWETVHKSDFERSASHIRQNIGEDGKCYLEKGREYKIFAPKDDENQFTCSLVFCFKAMGTAEEHAITFTNEDEYAEWFTFRLLDYDATGDAMPIVYEVGGVRYTETVDGFDNSVDETKCACVTGATSVFLYNADATIYGEKGEDGENGDSCFIRFSANADGTDFTEEWSEGQNYIGFATGQTAPTDKSGYEWCLFVGSGGGGDVSINDIPNSVIDTMLDGTWYIKTFYVGDIAYTFEYGMTWSDFIDSEYCPTNGSGEKLFYAGGVAGEVVEFDDFGTFETPIVAEVYLNGATVEPTDTIVPNGEYTLGG